MMFAERVRRALVDHRFVKALALVAFASHATSLGAGYLVDDHTHRYFARGETIPGGPRGLWDMYRFADGGVGVRQAIDEGFHPWWTSSSLKLAFFRPVASLLRFVEEKAFGDHAVFAHLVSCALFVATVVALHAAYRRWIGGAAAGLAALLFALDDAHATTVCEGETVSTPKLDVTVGKVTPEGSPITLVFRFRATLDRPDVTFVRWTSNGPAGKPGYAPFVLPRPGETMALEPVDFAEALAGR